MTDPSSRLDPETAEMKSEAADAAAQKPAKAGASFLVRLLQGMIIGVGAILPGISGGVLCAIFGLYLPIMEVLAHPKQNLKRHIRMLIPVGIGIVIGVLGLAKVVAWAFNANEALATCLFAGLILGMLPSLWKTARSYGKPPRSSYVSLGAAFLILFVLVVFVINRDLQVPLNPFWFAVGGGLWALGVIVPGMTAASSLLFLGLYEPLMSAISGFVGSVGQFITGRLSFSETVEGMSLLILLPFAAGLILTILGLARPIHYLLKRFPSQVYHAIFGIAAAMLLPLLPRQFNSLTDGLLKLGCLIVGFVFAYFVDKLSQRYAS